MISPRNVQWNVINNAARYKVIVAGRRGGKSVLSMMLMYQKAVENPGGKVWYIAPSYKMARNIMWEQLKTFLYNGNWVSKVNESRLEITLVNGSTITLWGADNPDSLRGSGKLDYVIFDEAAYIKETVWSEIVRPILADNNGGATFITTPRGATGWFYDLAMHAKEQAKYLPDLWWFFQYTTREGGNIDPEEIEIMEADMTPRQVRQELDANFESSGLQIYEQFDRDYHTQHSDFVAHEKELLVIGTDFNHSPIVSVIGVLRVDDQPIWSVDGYHQAIRYANENKCKVEITVIDEVEIYNSNTYELADEINARYPNRSKIIFPDASGGNNNTKGITDHEILREQGFNVQSLRKNPPVLDRIASVNKALLSAKGETSLWINKKCKTLIHGLERHQFKEGTRQPEKDGPNDLSHMNDALGYMVYTIMPLQNENIDRGKLPRFGAI